MNSKYYIAVTVLFFASIYSLRPAATGPLVDVVPKTKAVAVRDVKPAVQPISTAAPASVPVAKAFKMPVAIPKKNQVEDFLQSSSLKQMIRNDLHALVQKANSLEIPEGPIVREEKSSDDSGLYYKEMASRPAVVKKVMSKGKVHSESYFNGDNGSSFHRQYDKNGSLRAISIRMNPKEAIMLDFYSDGKLSSITESVDGSVTEQKWDINNVLVQHKTSGVINGKYTTVDHMANNAIHQDEDNSFNDIQ